MVASERFPPCGMVTAEESPSGWAESAANKEPDSACESGGELMPIFA
jgi:hypothetical protein